MTFKAAREYVHAHRAIEALRARTARMHNGQEPGGCFRMVLGPPNHPDAWRPCEKRGCLWCDHARRALAAERRWAYAQAAVGGTA